MRHADDRRTHRERKILLCRGSRECDCDKYQVVEICNRIYPWEKLLMSSTMKGYLITEVGTD